MAFVDGDDAESVLGVPSLIRAEAVLGKFELAEKRISGTSLLPLR